MRLAFASVFATICAAYASAAIIDSYQQVIYDRNPKLRISGEFTGTDKQIHLKFFPPLEQGVDYTLSVLNENRLVLSLKEGKR